MADLRELHAAVASLAQSGKTAKVSFYYTRADDLGMHSGSISVESGADCYLSFEQLPAEEALEAMVGLALAKVATLPSMSINHVGDAVPMEVVLERLDPGKRPAPAPAPVATEPMPAVATKVEVAAAKAPHVFYSHLSMQRDVLDLLQPLFGVGAQKKIEEFAQVSPPINHPADFLDKCRQHAAMMLGPRKAEELFKPLFDKLSLSQ
ncbi:MAG: hypothetical protein KAY03_00970 [Arenimonas sp.]|nr:hypothetical protein [Arenimonas sp.]